MIDLCREVKEYRGIRNVGDEVIIVVDFLGFVSIMWKEIIF